jgi:hypothetical protein
MLTVTVNYWEQPAKISWKELWIKKIKGSKIAANAASITKFRNVEWMEEGKRLETIASWKPLKE